MNATTPTGTGGGNSGVTAPPKKGERFRCDKCGMEIQVTADCPCKDGDHVQFRCCDRHMTKV